MSTYCLYMDQADKQHAVNVLTFLERTPLKGSEAETFMAAVEWLRVAASAMAVSDGVYDGDEDASEHDVAEQVKVWEEQRLALINRMVEAPANDTADAAS
jgi:hypothetical protein